MHKTCGARDDRFRAVLMLNVDVLDVHKCWPWLISSPPVQSPSLFSLESASFVTSFTITSLGTQF